MQIIIPHTNTDLDAIGAAVGAQVLYPEAIIVLPGVANSLAAEFISLHRYNLKITPLREIDLRAVTRAIVVDTADPARLGPLQEVAKGVEIHLYDHHPPEPNDLQGRVEVRSQVGATCTILAELIEESGAAITPFQATALLVGVYADTGSLSLLGTTARDARAAAFLLSKGASLQAASRFIEVNLNPAQQQLLQRLQESSRWVTANGARIRLMAAETDEYIGGLALVVHRLQELMPAPALFVAVRMADRVHVVGRSGVPWVDTARVLAAFGGGGHAAASSAVAKGVAVAEVMERLEAVLHQKVQRPLMARDVMSSPVKSISLAKPIHEAERLMLRHGHTGLPVVDGDGRLKGIVSLRDVEKARRHGMEHAPVKGIMKAQVVTVTPDQPVDAVQDLMISKDIGRVPVLQGESLVGIITRSDLLGLLYGGPPPRWHRTLYVAAGAPNPHDQGAERAVAAVEAASASMRALLRTAGAVAEEQGVASYVVGGFVRDLLLGRQNFDLDMVVEGDGIAYAHALADALGGRVNEVPRFGTAHVYLGGTDPDLPSRIDVATARREFYEHAAALPVVQHADLREDLYRRDFSINAMAIRLGPHAPEGLVDFFGGLQDLASRQIRILHTLSFVEDPTRILRAIRFAHRYGFTLEPETERCARTALREGFLDRVSRERLRNEMLLILQEERSGGALRMLGEMGLYQRLLPGAALTDEQVRMVDRVEELAQEAPELYAKATPWLLKLMILLHPLPLNASAEVVHHLRLKREESHRLLHVLTAWRVALATLQDQTATAAQTVRILAGWPPEGLLLLHLLGAGGRVAQYCREWRPVKLAITGADLRRAGVPMGPQIGRILTRVLADRLDGIAPDRESQLALALRYAHEEE